MTLKTRQTVIGKFLLFLRLTSVIQTKSWKQMESTSQALIVIVRESKSHPQKARYKLIIHIIFDDFLM